jgi:hypothetical protein
MSRIALRATAVAAVIALLGVGSFAIAGGGSKNFRTGDLNGYEENPDISTVATGDFSARLSDDGTALRYELSYSGLEGDVTMSHVHFGKRAINGGISFWLCGTAAAPGPAGTPACPAPGGTIEDEITAADVVGPVGQGIEAMNLAEILAAMRAGHAYANVHSTKWPGGEIRAQINDRDRGHKGDDD